MMMGQDTPEPKETSPTRPPVEIALRIGARLATSTGFAGGLDLTFNRLSIGHGWSTRLDIEGMSLRIDANNTGPVFALTLDQVFSEPLRRRRGLYIGAGIGSYDGFSLFPYQTAWQFLGKSLFGSEHHLNHSFRADDPVSTVRSESGHCRAAPETIDVAKNRK
jgi:hypothetical protein